MANYTNSTNVSQFIQRALSTNETNSLSGYVLAAVDTWINRYLNTQFDDAAASTRYYDGGGHSIDIDPCQTITAVKSINNDDTDSYTYTENTEWVGEPVNDLIKREIVYRGRRRFPRGLRRMAVTGKFTEYAGGVPSDIALAATRLAAGVLNAGKIAGQGGNIQLEQLEGHEVRYDITANALEALMYSDPILAGILGARKELYLYDDANFSGGDSLDADDDW